MKHILDNPVWHALITGNSNLAIGNNAARYLPAEVSPFAGISEITAANFKILHKTIPFNSPIAIFTNLKHPETGPWAISKCIEGFQMIYTATSHADERPGEFIPLNKRHVPEMLNLAKLTNPGPFLAKTIEFGNYEGIFRDGKLVSMAGQRLHSNGYVEISAVCTHPEFTGQGFARRLILNQVRNIHNQHETAYLHVRADNGRAIKIYEQIGFKTREEMIIYMIIKDAI